MASGGLELLTPQKLPSKSINDYWDNLVKSKATKEDGLRYELMRLSTFSLLPQRYPVSALKLAKAGFYYTGPADEVKCYSCGVKVKDWSNEEAEPLDVHRRYQPHCPFLCNKVENIPLGITNEPTDKETTPPGPHHIKQNQQHQPNKQNSIYATKSDNRKDETSNYGDSIFSKPVETVNRNQSIFTKSLDVTSDTNLTESLFKHPVDNQSGHQSIFQQSDFFGTTSLTQNETRNTRQSIFNPPVPRPEQSDAESEVLFQLPTSLDQLPSVGDKDITNVPLTRKLQRTDTRTYAHQEPETRNLRNPTGFNVPKEQTERNTMPHRGTSPIPYDPSDYRHEGARLDSYSGFQSNSGVSINEMAKSGLYYLGDGDRVQCVFCRGILRNWEAGDVPHEEHARHFEQCPFIQDPSAVGNKPLQQNSNQGLKKQESSSNVVTGTAVHQKFSILSTRIETFRTFPRDRTQKSDELAKAGFFYTGTSDNVKCFFCDGGLRNWEANDDPFTEHARWFPRCGYLLMSKGQDYIQDVQDKYNPQPMRPPPRSRNESNVMKHPVEMTKVNELMRGRLTKLVLDMGVNRDTIKKVIIQRMEEFGSDEFFPNAESLYDAVVEYEDEEKYRQENPQAYVPEVTFDDNEQSPDIENVNDDKKKKKKKKKKNKKPEKSDTNIDPEDDQQQYQYMDNEQVTQLTEDVNRLKEERTCKICMDEEVNIVFLKCGHMVCCSSCAPSMKHCPICRQQIKGTVRVFLS